MKAFVFVALFLTLAVVAVYGAEKLSLDEYNAFSKFEHFIAKYGHKGVSFLKCMGHDWVQHCSGPTLNCMAARNVPGCISLIKCEGKDANACIHHLH